MIRFELHFKHSWRKTKKKWKAFPFVSSVNRNRFQWTFKTLILLLFLFLFLCICIVCMLANNFDAYTQMVWRMKMCIIVARPIPNRAIALTMLCDQGSAYCSITTIFYLNIFDKWFTKKKTAVASPIEQHRR